MKKVLIGTLVVVVTLGVLGFVFREPLIEAIAERITADMFVEADTDSFDPGVPVASRLPEIAARHDGRVIHDLGEFAGENGLVLFAVRSVEW